MRNTGQSYGSDYVLGGTAGKNTLQGSKCGGCVVVGNVHVPVPHNRSPEVLINNDRLG